MAREPCYATLKTHSRRKERTKKGSVKNARTGFSNYGPKKERKDALIELQ